MSKIDIIKWGSVKVGDVLYKDCIMTPKGHFSWDFDYGYNKGDGFITSHQHKTKHHRGIQIHSVRPLINYANIFVISTGIKEELGVNISTIEYLCSFKKEVYILNTTNAVKKYNELIDNGKKVVAFIHSTC